MKMMFFIVAVIAISLAANYFRWGYDDTDDKKPGAMFGKRSGLTLYVDHMTGVQYIKAGIFGAACPRIDKDGHPIIAKD
jgi:hypothetical protein